MPSLLGQLVARQNLSTEQATELFHTLLAPTTADADRTSLLAALRDKGETVNEVAAFAAAMRSAALDPAIPRDDRRPILDIVGTGGDGASTLNISTAAALLAAAASNGRIRVVKHGNRAISSKSGASDVLAALGIPAAMPPHVARALLDRTGFTYLHAPHYHPSVAAVAAARKALGTRSIFNLLGPLTNPARPDAALIGAYSPAAATLIAHAMRQLGFRSGTVVHTVTAPNAGLDEATATDLPFTEHHVSEAGVTTAARTGADYRFSPCTLDDLRGKEAAYNAQIVRDIFSGRNHPATDTIILNTALALRLCHSAGDIHSCAASARAAIADGRAANLLRELDAFGREQSTHAA
jgi:anthranilate phosphoribosyltransferase